MDELPPETKEDPASPLRAAVPRVPRVRLVGTSGPADGERWTSAAAQISIGSHPSNDIVLEHETISRFHCEIVRDEHGSRARDLGSRNGTTVDGVVVLDARLRHGSELGVGPATLSFFEAGGSESLRLSSDERFGALVGASVAMRAVFAQLERAAESAITVLLTGETGTGKELAARAIHDEGARRDAPFVVVDCTTLAPELIESQLFGHERGAFSGALEQRAGAFELARGGTVFLDEVGEIPVDLQPKLLRVLEARTLRRVGGSEEIDVDVRVISATNRDLRREVNEKRFRSDLFFRLAVLSVALPPLRGRLGDLPLLVATLLDELGAAERARERLTSPAALARMQRAAWPGNVRQLRNYLVRSLVLDDDPPLEEGERDAPAPAFDPTVSFAVARERATGRFERDYLRELLSHHDNHVARAAKAARIDRTHLYRLLRKHRP